MRSRPAVRSAFHLEAGDTQLDKPVRHCDELRYQPIRKSRRADVPQESRRGDQPPGADLSHEPAVDQVPDVPGDRLARNAGDVRMRRRETDPLNGKGSGSTP